MDRFKDLVPWQQPSFDVMARAKARVRRFGVYGLGFRVLGIRFRVGFCKGFMRLYRVR